MSSEFFFGGGGDFVLSSKYASLVLARTYGEGLLSMKQLQKTKTTML